MAEEGPAGQPPIRFLYLKAVILIRRRLVMRTNELAIAGCLPYVYDSLFDRQLFRHH